MAELYKPDARAGLAGFGRRAGLWLGPLLGLAAYAALPSAYDTAQGSVALGHAQRATVGVTVWMGMWWMTEAIPIAATALIPLCAFPLFGIASASAAAAPYGHPLIFLFMGGFLVALAMERWGLHRRLAFRALRLAGARPPALIGAFMLTSAALSMWVSNTATAIMMLPVAMSLRDEDGDDDSFMVCLLLGIAYACSIGGIATPIGTPPNVFLMSFLDTQMDRQISFARWMMFAVPLVVVFLPVAWLLLTRVLFRLGDEPIGGAARLERVHADMGRLGTGEKSAAAVFSGAALAWVLRPLLVGVEIGGVQPFAGLTDSTVAVSAALALFLLPGNRDDPNAKPPRALDWETAVRLPWGILILFGAGLSLAAAIAANGVDQFLAHQMAGLGGLPGPLVVAAVGATVVLATELASNTAITATFVPLLAAVAPALGIDPMLLILPATIAASLAFMLPVATPPNAVVFGSGLVEVGDMRRAGVWMNVASIVLLPVLTYLLIAPVIGL